MTRFLAFIVLAFICYQTLPAQRLLIPKNYSIIDSVKGDLNKDGINELVVAYNTKPVSEYDTSFESIPRELIIYKKVNNAWTVWVKSKTALYGSTDGGMMGDPFGSIEIKKGVLLVSQNGGSSWKWGHTDVYRFQEGKFYLIGYTSSYGKICEYWEDIDFNISTGKIVLKKQYQSCDDNDIQKIDKQEDETFYYKGVKINIENRNYQKIKIVSPKFKHELYITTGE